MKDRRTPGADGLVRPRYLTDSSRRLVANDVGEQVVTMTRGQLEELVTRAVTTALGSGMTGPALVDTQDLARLIGCSRSHVDRLRQQGMPSVSLGRGVRFEPQAVVEWLRARECAGG